MEFLFVIFKVYIFKYVYLCMLECEFAYSALRGQRASDSLDLELLAVVSYWMWGLKTKLRFSVKAV